MDSKKITVKNPYRVGSKLHKIYEIMSDGKWHDLEGITEEVYGYLNHRVVLYRRRTASALRTIRRKQGGLCLTWWNGAYKLREARSSTVSS